MCVHLVALGSSFVDWPLAIRRLTSQQMPGIKQVIKKPSCVKHGCFKRPAANFLPKRGKARMALRRPASRKCMRKPVAYTRVTRPSRNTQRDLVPSVTINDFYKGQSWTVNYLIAQKFLKIPKNCDLCGMKRTACHKGTRTGIRSETRCMDRSCRRRLNLFTGNPYFTNQGHSISIIDQAAILFNLCIGISRIHIHLQLGIPHTTLERFGQRFETHLHNYVINEQEKIVLGDDTTWADVECDEVTLARRRVDSDHVTWSQYLGIVQRGRPESLILVRLPDRVTGTRAPGPGPLRKRDWLPIFQRYVEDRHVILHTDSARAYEAFTTGIRKTRVVHQAKKDEDGNWVKPHFTKFEKVHISEQESIAVLAGTQYIDGFWRILRQEILSHHGSDVVLDRKVRMAQWRYWTMRRDRWLALAATF